MVKLYGNFLLLYPKIINILANVKDTDGVGNAGANNVATGGGGNMTSTAEQLCSDLAPLLRLVGMVILAVKIVVPIILIVVGMIKLAQAVGDQDDVAKATKALVQKLIIAVLVFLVATIVGVVMNLIGGSDYRQCTTCLNQPWDCTGNYMTIQ